MEKRALAVLIVVMLLCGALFACAYANQARYRNAYQEKGSRRALNEALGLSLPGLSAECAGARNILEGAYGAMADIPGGYCYYQSCDVVGPPTGAGKE